MPVQLRDHFTRLRDVWAREVASTYGKFNSVHGLNVPGWLIGGGGDVTASQCWRSSNMTRQRAGPTRHPRPVGQALRRPGRLPEWRSPQLPMGYAPRQRRRAPLLARLGQHPVVRPGARRASSSTSPSGSTSARREADTFYARLLAGEMVSEWGVLPFAYPQIAYGINSITQGLLALHQATGDDKYARLAGLAAGWFYGNNSARFAMYDPATGRGYDGLMGPSEFRVNRNGGAEFDHRSADGSAGGERRPGRRAIPGLQARSATSWQVLEAETAPDEGRSRQLIQVRAEHRRGPVEQRPLCRHRPGRCLQPDVQRPGGRAILPLRRVPAPVGSQQAFNAEALRASAPPAIDGDLGEWSAAQPLSATTTANILRGAAGWGGADKDAFVGYLDVGRAEPLRRGPRVRPGAQPGRDRALGLEGRYALGLPGHQPRPQQRGGQADPGPDARAARKSGTGRPTLSCATPSWPGSRATGSYIYEARLPWSSLGVSKVEAAKQMGLELGRGCCGSGFQDLSGTDPDIGSNLVPLTLVDKLSPGAAARRGPSGPDAVALRWSIDDGGPRKHSRGRRARPRLPLARPADLHAGGPGRRLSHAAP